MNAYHLSRTLLLKGFITVALTLSGGFQPAGAQTGVPGHHGSVPGPDAQALSPLDEAMLAGVKRMQALQVTGNPDYDFVVLMREHHQAAIDMARAYLQHGENRAVRRIARTLIEERQAQINQLDQHEKRLRAKGVRTP